MFRTDLGFLEKMFPQNDYKDYNILVINQTDNKRQLVSDHENIRIINSEERGLSQSRNLAIRQAIGEICLVADDDVQYVANLNDIIINAHGTYKDAAVVTFQMNDAKGALYRDYPNITYHTQKTIGSVNGVVISFKTASLLKTETYYDPNFGLGCTFQTANEYVFMKNVLKSRLQAVFVDKVILAHPNHSSGKDMGSDRVIYARAALTHKYYGYLSYLWVFKYLRFLIAHRYIQFKEVFKKMEVGFAGIRKYRTLIKK